MVKILSILALLGTTFLLSSSPWLSGLAYATVSIVQPHFVWFWAFEDFPVFKISAGLSILAWLIRASKKELRGAIYKEPITISVFALWLIFQVSNFLSPYPEYTTGATSRVILDTLDTIVLMFLVVLGLIDSKRALLSLAVIYIAATLYYAWWSNSAYFGNEWTRFINGRLNGPADSPYKDGNVFSILFVIGMPFLLFAAVHTKKVVYKYALIACIPFVWHAVVLCASRGALLAMVVSTAAATLLIRSKSLNIVMAIGFVAFIVYQGGQLTERTNETLAEASSETDQPLNPRLLSWAVGWDMIKGYPILGVGPQRFKVASAQLYPGKSPHVAHNTFLNFAANTGIFAGLIYLFFFYRSYKLFLLNKKIIPQTDELASYLNNASICALAGFFVGALFLDLIVFEPFYFLMILIVCLHYSVSKEHEARMESPDGI